MSISRIAAFLLLAATLPARADVLGDDATAPAADPAPLALLLRDGTRRPLALDASAPRLP